MHTCILQYPIILVNIHWLDKLTIAVLKMFHATIRTYIISIMHVWYIFPIVLYRILSRVMGDLLEEQYEHLLKWLSKHGISESIQLKNNGQSIPLLSLDLYDLCRTVLTCAANPTKPERFQQLRSALLLEIPSNLCLSCNYEAKLHMLPKLNPEIDQLAKELIYKVQEETDRIGEVVCYPHWSEGGGQHPQGNL